MKCQFQMGLRDFALGLLAMAVLELGMYVSTPEPVRKAPPNRVHVTAMSATITESCGCHTPKDR